MCVVAITDGTGVTQWVRLRPMTGQDELRIVAGDPSAAIALLGRLARDELDKPIDLSRWTVSQVDRLLALLYTRLYGDRAECRVTCRSCGSDYEFTVALSQLIQAQDAARPGPPDADATWTLPDGRRVRAPVLADLASAPDPNALLQRLVVSGDPAADPSAVTEFLDRSAPVLSVDLDGPCAHCASAATTRFDLARYLVGRLAGERPYLLREAHLIASRYGWSHSEVMALARDDRRAYAGLIEAGRTAGRRARRAG